MTAIPQPLITKYRPQAFDEVLGHELQVEALRRAISQDTRPHSYLFTGPSGTGKTTLARIVAREVDAEVMEIDAASNAGVEAMRQLVDIGNYMPFSESGRRMIIIDEVHATSKAAFQVLLKILEEPPAHLYFALCTTELHKVPETIVLRCLHTALKPLKPNDISELVETIIDLEGWKVEPDVVSSVVQAATGQPRKALSMLQAVQGVQSRDEVKRILALVENDDTIIELCQILLQGKLAWPRIRTLLQAMDADDFEAAAIAGARYISAAMLKTDDEKRARHAWSLLEALTFPASSWDKKVLFLTAIGRILWSEG